MSTLVLIDESVMIGSVIVEEVEEAAEVVVRVMVDGHIRRHRLSGTDMSDLRAMAHLIRTAIDNNNGCKVHLLVVVWS